ncbi:cationic peptide transport system substrate-binding protein [Bisgaardia hudsonensis]|uniref:Cationic peptide transport system substrate-binding protein n=1 Tax=Bisgaardia hudsonensis TaxID=109472 RepID=A0A4V2SJE1_9PAST|nr:ABC transporter substrate-binding protein [Bisgaardia hudsonensis]QLB12822.1 peptide ABC transporter substrate-binding protein [Bisgaardia hudsonensis]TCP14380.1 cationic peptide transport system substrate-binding protein [Bisgaardia hudsonensis]
MLKIKIIRFTVLLCCLFAITFNVFSAPRVPKILTDNGLIYCTNANGFSFNPQTADAGTSMNVVTEQIYNKLFEIRDNSSTLEPVLARSFSISDDGKKIIINLRHNVKFHDTDWFTPTRDFNAEDVVFSLNRVLGQNASLPELDTGEITYKNPQYKIFHEKAKKVRFPFFESIKLSEKIKSVKATKPDQVEITLYQPDASVLSHLASQYAVILSQEYALQLSADDNLVQLNTLPVGTGPYKIKNYIRNQYVRLEKNPDYWNKDAKINNIIIDLSTERTGRIVKFLNNECHISANLEVSQLGLLKNNNRYSLISTEGMNLSYLAFNLQKPLIQDVDFRRAISQSIDRKRITKTIYHNTAYVANNIIPKISWASVVNTPDYAYDYNPEAAKKYLANKEITLNIWVFNEEQVYNPAPIKMAELIKSDLEKVGVKVNVTNVTRTFLISQIQHKKEDYDLILTGWLAGNLDPDSFMRPILSCGSQTEITNLSNWCYAPFELAMNQALITTNLRSRARYYNIAQEIVLSKVPIIPLANVKRLLVVNNRVEGLKMSPFGNVNFSMLSLKQESR